jgi:signal transduction histidine kinase/CheY-like chemotaxis protein
MPKKQKIDKQLNKLFQGLKPEETSAEEKPRARVETQAAPVEAAPVTPIEAAPATPKPAEPVLRNTSALTPIATTPVKRHTATLIPPEPLITKQLSTSSSPSDYSINFQSGIRDWATLRVMDESDQRVWTTDEQLLIKQVIDQLSLALENARLFQETQQALEVTNYRAEAQNLINDIAAEFLNVNDPATINVTVNSSLGRVGRFMKIDRAYIFLFNQDGATMDNTHEWRGPGVESYLDEFRNVSRTALPYMMQHMNRMEPFVISNVADLPDEATMDRNEYQRKHIQSIMCAPIALENQTVGFVGLDSVNKQRDWGDEDVATLRLYGQIAISALDRARNQEALARRNEYLAVSAEIGKLVTSTLDLNSIFTRTVKLITERFNFYHAAIYIVEETGFNAIFREGTGDAGAEMKLQNHSLAVNASSIVGKVTSEGQAVIVNDVSTDPLHKVNTLLPETRAEAAIPLRIGNRIIGAVDIQSRNINAFTENEIIVLQTLADQVAIAIDNARSFELSQEAVKEMRETDRVKSQFLANMSHELRTPLNSIIGFSRVILKGIDGPVTELQQQDLTAIYNSGQHLLSLINDILDLAKIEAGKMELAFDEVNMSDVTTSVLSTMSGLVKDKPITLKKVIEPDIPTVRADAIRVRQVMINLLSNAAKFTDEGDIVVEVGVKPSPTGRMELQVSVIDTGPGISDEDQAKLFQAFSQVDDSPTRKTGGTGLGLSICQHLINMHGGRIWVNSVVGKGSTFSFTLPLYRKESEEDADANAGRKVILAIDDDPQVIGLYERYLQPQNYQVVSLTDPGRAVERVKQLKPYAVTLDIMMPGVDGWQVLDRLKNDPETRNTPVIICSIIEDHDRGYTLGAADYLTKPILEDDLVNALDRLNSDGSIREVLVIDDDRDDLRLVGKMLNDDGRYKPVLVEGGKNGWDIISTGSPPHAVILDLFMPDLNGFQILENMRVDPRLRDIPVIVISGMDLSSEQKEQLNEFGQRLLSKGSFNEKELLTTLQRSLERVGAKKN